MVRRMRRKTSSAMLRWRETETSRSGSVVPAPNRLNDAFVIRIGTSARWPLSGLSSSASERPVRSM